MTHICARTRRDRQLATQPLQVDQSSKERSDVHSRYAYERHHEVAQAELGRGLPAVARHRMRRRGACDPGRLAVNLDELRGALSDKLDHVRRNMAAEQADEIPVVTRYWGERCGVAGKCEEIGRHDEREDVGRNVFIGFWMPFKGGRARQGTEDEGMRRERLLLGSPSFYSAQGPTKQCARGTDQARNKDNRTPPSVDPRRQMRSPNGSPSVTREAER